VQHAHRSGGGQRAHVDGHGQRRHPAGERDVEGGRRERVHRVQQGQRGEVLPVRQRQPSAQLAPARRLPAGPARATRLDPDLDPVHDRDPAAVRQVRHEPGAVRERHGTRLRQASRPVGSGSRVQRRDGAQRIDAWRVVLEQRYLHLCRRPAGPEHLGRDDRLARIGRSQVGRGCHDDLLTPGRGDRRPAEHGKQVPTVRLSADRPVRIDDRGEPSVCLRHERRHRTERTRICPHSDLPSSADGDNRRIARRSARWPPVNARSGGGIQGTTQPTTHRLLRDAERPPDAHGFQPSRMYFPVHRHFRHACDPRNLTNGEEASLQQGFITRSHDTCLSVFVSAISKQARITRVVNSTRNAMLNLGLALSRL
jgi:hypothetical protein